MDQFEVLVGNYGIKPQGKSAPMAAVKSGIKSHNSKPANSWNSSFGSSSRSKSIIDDHDDPFQFNSGTGFQKQNSGGFGDFDFGFPPPPGKDNFTNGASNGGSGLKFDMESMFKDTVNLGPKPSNSNVYDDLFSGFSGKNTSSVNNDDLLSYTPKKVDPVDDFFGTLSSESKSSKFDHEDELIPGFGRPSSTNLGTNQYPKIPKPVPQSTNQYPKIPKPVAQEASFIDIESSSVDGGQYGEKEDAVNDWNFQAAAPADAVVDLDSFFTPHSGTSGANMSTATSEVDIDSLFSIPNPNTIKVSEKPVSVQNTNVDVDSLLGIPKVKTSAGVTRTKSKNDIPDLFSGTSSQSRNNLSSSSAANDFDLFFGGSMGSGDFEEIEGEDDERRKARHDRYKRTQARMAKALADMNSREFQAQQEQEERHRIAEIKDSEMKVWAAGKEGNLRALLSSLDQVLWPGCGWKALSLADLITSSQVKVAYKKAALCVHPDKVQQKGANAQQKYVAEKVFDLLKEASNKFSQEELR